MSRWLIRPERNTDVDAIDALIVDAFLRAPHTSHTEQHIVRALRHAKALTVSLVGEHADARSAASEIIGHVAASPVSVSAATVSPGHVDGWFGLGPLAVRPDWQRRGLGAELTYECLAALRALGARGCVVLGDPTYYGRFGFRAEPRLVLPGVPPEYFQTLAFDGSVPTSTVSYHDAFGAAG
ncbi:MAG TPA: N-acetyltransferase [Steroidobacteraceae bacterium]|nr:N-acetyltransferase [Steroidobacteraceae bacterium]